MSYSCENPPKVGELIRVADHAWHKPYCGKVLEVLEVDYAGDIWVIEDDSFTSGVCLGGNSEGYEALPLEDFRVGDLVKIADPEMCKCQWYISHDTVESLKGKTLEVSELSADSVKFAGMPDGEDFYFPKDALKHVPHFPLQESNNPVEIQQENSEIENTEVQYAVYETDGDTILMKGTKEQVKSYLEEGMSYARLKNMLEEGAIKVVKLQEVTATLGGNGVEFKL